MNRLERLQAILIQLQSKKIVKAQEIADRFEISLRTVYRDIRSLEEAGVPIGAEAGIGYFLTEHYNLPPVMFTPEEASALLLASKLMDSMSDNGMKNSFNDALYKIKAVLRHSEKNTLEVLQNQISVFNYSQKINQENENYLQTIQKALIENKKIHLTYYSNYSDSENVRTALPIGLTYYGGFWHLIGFCELRKAYRDFRLDRIKKLHIALEAYNPNTLLTLKQYFESIQSPEDLHSIEILCTKETLRFIKNSKHWYGFTHQEEYDDTFMKLYFRNADLQGFSRWIIYGGDNVTILQPVELKNIIELFVKSLSKHYLKS